MKLQRAYRFCEHPNILVSIANRFVELQQPEKAREALSKIQNPDARLRRLLTKVRKRIEEQLQKPIVVSVRARPAGASVSVDGGRFVRLPAELTLRRGTRRFTFRAPGRRDKTVTRTLVGMQPVTVSTVLPQAFGRWKIALKSGSLKNVRILFNGRIVGLTSRERAQRITYARSVAPGRYTVNCLQGVDGVANVTVVVKSNEVSVGLCDFPQKGLSGTGKIVAWTGIGLAAASLAAGIGVLASYADDVATYKPPQYRIESTKPAGGALLLITSVGFGVVSGLIFGKIIKL